MPEWSSLCEMHRWQSERQGERVALRFPQNGLYHDVSWAHYRRQADQAAVGLIHLGIKPGDHVVFPASAGTWVEVDDERLLVCRVVELLGVLETAES